MIREDSETPTPGSLSVNLFTSSYRASYRIAKHTTFIYFHPRVIMFKLTGNILSKAELPFILKKLNTKPDLTLAIPIENVATMIQMFINPLNIITVNW